MGLDDFKTQTEPDIGSISTRKKPSNMMLSNRTWRQILVTYPDLAFLVANEGEEAQTKCVIQLLDNMIQDGVQGEVISDDRKEEIKEVRSQIVESSNV